VGGTLRDFRFRNYDIGIIFKVSPPNGGGDLEGLKSIIQQFKTK
jgi:hypothetical protein